MIARPPYDRSVCMSPYIISVWAGRPVSRPIGRRGRRRDPGEVRIGDARPVSSLSLLEQISGCDVLKISPRVANNHDYPETDPNPY